MSEVDYIQDHPSPDQEGPHISADKIHVTLEKAQSTISDDSPCRCCARHVREAKRRPPVGVWPVAQIIVQFEAVQTAWGRQSVQVMGYMVRIFCSGDNSFCLLWMVQKFKKALADMFLTHEERHNFLQTASLHGSFFHTHGHDDEGFVCLQSIGWAELVGNITKIKVVYTSENKPAA